MNVKQNVRKILLIDSNEILRIYFRDIFWIHGNNNLYEVEVVSSFEEAEKKLEYKDSKPDIIFLDVVMSIKGAKNSIENEINRSVSFIKKIKNDKTLSDIKIIIYSDQKEKAIKDKVAELGIEGYLIKGELMPKEIIKFVDKIYE
ncbi:MAG: response regulator [Candidatus Paceibacterota bacterium]